MNYTIEWLKENIKTGGNFKYLFFYSHKRNENGLIDKNCLSQFWPCTFNEFDKPFCCAKQYMMYRKAQLFEDLYTANQIINETSPYKIQKLGRQVSNFNGDIWDEYKFDIVCQGNYLKFSQNENLKTFLLSTDNKVLVEAAQNDKIWGVGMKETDIEINNPFSWNGLNLLGFALMNVRDLIN